MLQCLLDCANWFQIYVTSPVCYFLIYFLKLPILHFVLFLFIVSSSLLSIVWTTDKGIEHLHEMEGIHAHCHKLLDLMSKEISMSNMQQRQKGCVDGAIFCAIKNGNFEFLFRIVKEIQIFCGQLIEIQETYSCLLSYIAKLKSLALYIYGLEEKNVMIYDSDAHGNFILHMAGMSAPSNLLNHISGPALEMQRETTVV
jgi:hypothetical protein